MKKIIILVVQIMLLFLFSWLGNAFVLLTHLPIPGSVIGLLFLFIALERKWFKVTWFENGANFLLSQMLLFFVPSAVGIIQYGTLLRQDGIALFIIIAVSTLCVMTLTGIIAERSHQKRREHA